MADISLFPIYDETKFGEIINTDEPYVFGYESSDGSYHELVNEGGYLSEKEETHGGQWNINFFNLLVSRDIKIKNANKLYGPNGIACHNAEIGIYILWSSPSSLQRGVFNFSGSIANVSTPQVLKINGAFEKGTLRGDVNLTTVFYIRKEGTPDSNEFHLANTCGTKIGEVDLFNLSLDGYGSNMDIVYRELTNGALWEVVCNWDCPDSDRFVDTVHLVLNTKSPFFMYVNNVDTHNFNIHLFREILASAFVQIFEQYKEYDPDLSKLENAELGSVAHVIRHHIEVFDINTDTLSSESKTIRMAYEKILDK